ncbi:GerAB/ArcD/ProY family transporter [Marinicrinis sediminis]|uniref:GerAB/ArcD/ProY family transporter n=1 Tax=Marinicrinis sediminis TaxID=1652465 RepID=A0ABW5R9S2_9BACL
MYKPFITTPQLFTSIVLFELGSSIVVGLGMQAKQDAWLALLIGLVPGLLIFAVYAYLHGVFPRYSLVGILFQLFGSWIGSCLSIVYILYFIYIASRVLRDFISLIVIVTLDLTPIYMISLLMLAIIFYACQSGLAPLLRTGIILTFIVIVFWLITFILLLLSDVADFNRLLPVLEEGWKPVLQTAFPLTATFPFGEMVVFMMFLGQVKQPRSVLRIGVLALLFSALLLIITTILDIVVLGTEQATHKAFPFYTTVTKINIREIIQRMDALAVSILIIGMFYKISLFFYAALQATEEIAAQLRKAHNSHKVACDDDSSQTPAVSFPAPSHIRLPLSLLYAVILFLTSYWVANNFIQHIHIGLKWVPFYLHLPLQYILPGLMALMALWKSKKTQPSLST